eukprot:44644_1
MELERQKIKNKSKTEEKEEKKEENENEVKLWLTNIVKLPQYYILFEDDGYDDLKEVKTFTKTELKEMGITKNGHIKRLMRFIEQLSDNSMAKTNKSTNENNQSDEEKKDIDENNLVTNAVVICVAISEYDDKDKYKSLPSVKEDVTHYKKILGDKYNYTVWSSLDEFKNGRMTKKDVNKFINNCKLKIVDYDDDDFKCLYDGIFISISGHGTVDSIITSDGDKIKYTRIRQKLSSVESLENVPRIFCIDACRLFDANVKIER